MNFQEKETKTKEKIEIQVWVVGKVNNAIHWMNHYPAVFWYFVFWKTGR